MRGLFEAGIESCTVRLEAAQVRVHSSTDSDMYLDVQSQPVIEDCCKLRFGPLNGKASAADKEGAALWSQVKDFGWMRPEPSPNW